MAITFVVVALWRTQCSRAYSVLPPSTASTERSGPRAPREAEALARPTTQAHAPSAADAGESDASAPVEAGRAELVQSWLRNNDALAAKHVQRYCELLKLGSSLPPYVEPSRRADAATYLMGKVDVASWEGPRIGLLHLPEPLTERIGDWLDFTAADYAGFDFSWMRELLAYDSWSTARLRMDDPDLYRIDEYLLLNWMKLRLIKGREEHELAQASVEVRHLADLLVSTGERGASSMRLKAFIAERHVWESEDLPVPAELPTARVGYQLALLSLASQFFLYPGVSGAVREQALRCMPNAERCEALAQAIRETVLLSAVYPQAKADLQWLHAQSRCDQAHFSLLNDREPASFERLVGYYKGNALLEKVMASWP